MAPYEDKCEDYPGLDQAMLPRFLLIVGVTITVMIPLVWATYTLNPVFQHPPVNQSSQAHSEERQIASHDEARLNMNSKSVAVISSVGLGSANDLQPRMDVNSVVLAKPRPIELQSKQSTRPPLPEVRDQASLTARLPSGEQTNTPLGASLSSPSGTPDAKTVDHYLGFHVIMVCSEFTEAQKRRVGCP